MFNKRNKYKRIPEISETLLGFNKPSSKPSFYTSAGIEYKDVEGRKVVIPKANIPGFLTELRKLPCSWKQWIFATVFEFDDDNMLGWEDFIDKNRDLQNLDVKDQIAYWLIRLSLIAKKIHIADVGQNTARIDSSKSEPIVILYNDLNKIYGQLQKDLNDIDTQFSPSRHLHWRRKEAIDQFTSAWRGAIMRTMVQYKTNWDIYNIFLNLLVMASVVGLIALFIKNVYRSLKGEHLQLFQFELSHSKQEQSVSELFKKQFNFSHALKQTADNYFTEDLLDTKDSIEELEIFMRFLAFAIQDTDVPRMKPQLETFHGELSEILVAFKEKIGQINTKNSSFQQIKTEVEFSFMEKWRDKIKEFTGNEENLQRITNGTISNSLFVLIKIAGQFEKEIDQSPFFQDASEHYPTL